MKQDNEQLPADSLQNQREQNLDDSGARISEAIAVYQRDLQTGALTGSEKSLVSESTGLEESTTVFATLRGEDRLVFAAGVPEMTPAVLMESLLGKLPLEMLQLSERVPLAATMVWL